ncbi:MAG: hypothetical protein ACM3U1_09150 [Chloroflexota bacterium]
MAIIPKAVMDTCALLDALILNYYYEVSPHDFISRYVENVFKNRFIRRKISSFYNSIPVFITSSHAIGELQGLFNSRVKPFNEKENSKNIIKLKFWRLSIEYLKSKRLNESLIKLIELSSERTNFELMQSVGYIDAGIINIALRESMPIITKDNRTLKASVKNKDIPVIIAEEYAQTYL